MKPLRSPPLTNCSVYGQGFVAVAGTDTCIKLSGHVRVEYGWGNRPSRTTGGGRSDLSSSAWYGEPSWNADSRGGQPAVFDRLRPSPEPAARAGAGARRR